MGDEVWHCSMAEWLSIPCAIADRSCCMGTLAPTAFVLSHTSTVDEMSIPVAAVSIPIYYPTLTLEASFPWSML